MRYVVCVWIFISYLVTNPSAPIGAKENSWIEIRSPHFTVYSDAGEKKAYRVMQEFEKFHAVIRKFIPSIQSGPSIPTIVLAAKNERSLQSLLPEFWEQKGLARPSGLFVGGPEKNYVALRLDMDDDFRYHVVYHEYVHLLLRLNFPPLATWLDEGLAECLGHTVISDDTSTVGRPSAMQLKILKDERLLPIAELFAVDHESPYYREESKVSIFYAQSWALTHLLLLGDKGANASKLWKYLELIQKNVPDDEARAQAFGDLKELERRLNEYIMQYGFYAFKVENPSLRQSEVYSVRSVSRIESRTVRGDFFVATDRWVEAKELLDLVLAEDPENADALASLGVYYQRQNQQEEARKYFVAAANASSRSCITHYYAGIAAMQLKEYKNAETSFRQSIALNPQFAPAYSVLASILAMEDETVEEALALAQKAVELEPGVLSHQLNLANVLMHLEKVDLAIQVGERVEATAESARDREDARQFLLMARRYRDGLSEMKIVEELIEKQRQKENRQYGDHESQINQEEARRIQREATEKAIEETKRMSQRMLKEREDTYESRERAEREYLKQVEIAGAEGTATLEGVISEVRCFDPAGIELTIEVDGKLHTFHIANYFDVRFGAIDHKPDREMNPCLDLNGRKVTTTFIATPGAAYDGEVQSLGIYKD